MKKLLDILKEKKKNIINPDDFTFSDIGFEGVPDEFATVEEALEAEGGFDEYNQAQLQLLDELIEYVNGRIEND